MWVREKLSSRFSDLLGYAGILGTKICYLTPSEQGGGGGV